MKVRRVKRRADLLVFQDSWRKLAAGMPTRSPEWLLSWIEHYINSDDELYVLLFHDHKGSLRGLAPLYLQKAWGRATIKLLGSGDACTNHSTWLAAAGFEEQIGLKVAQFLLAHNSEWDQLHFDWIDSDDAAVNTTVASLEENGCLLRNSTLPNCWKIDLPRTWDEYLKMLSRKHRKQCRRLQRKYFDTGLVQVHTVKKEEDLERGFKIFLRLHAARWHNPAQPQGVFSDEKFCSFHKMAAREFLQKGQLHFLWLEYKGTPIAAEHQFIDANTLYAYQAGMDPAFRELRPGKLSLLASIQSAIASGCQSFDLLRGNETYKAHYRATPSACHDISVWPNRISGRVGYTLDYTNTRMRYYTRIGRYLVKQLLSSPKN